MTFMLPDSEITPEAFDRRSEAALPGHINMISTRASRGGFEGDFDIQHHHRGPNGFPHAGGLVTPADSLSGYAAAAIIQDCATGFTTIEMKSNFFAAAPKGRVLAYRRHNPGLGLRSHQRQGQAHGLVPLLATCVLGEGMKDFPACPECSSVLTYEDGNMLICPECGHEWAEAAPAGARVIRDSVGNPLTDGDTVTVIKDLRVKGSALVVKRGTKVKNIRLVDGDHDIDCKIDEIGATGLKSEFVKKV